MSPLLTFPAPPVMNTVSPIMRRAIGLTRITAIFAISSGKANRPYGVFGKDKSSSTPFLCNNGVATGPGARALTVIPYGSSVLAKPRVNPLMPHLEMVYAQAAGLMLEADEILRILPWILLSFIYFPTCWERKKTPFRFVSITLSNISGVPSLMSHPDIPALFTSMSILFTPPDEFCQGWIER